MSRTIEQEDLYQVAKRLVMVAERTNNIILNRVLNDLATMILNIADRFTLHE